MVRFFIFLLILATFFACRSQQSSASVLVQTDSTTLVLEESQNLFLEREQMNLTFARIIEDSRCPEGVHCVWAGVAAVELTAMGTFTRPQTLYLATTDLPDKKYAKTVVFQDYVIRLDALEPYPSKDDLKKVNQKPNIRLVIKHL